LNVKIKLLLDEDTQLVLAQALRKRGYDVIHVQESDRKGLSDSQQLAYAVVSERCFFTYNLKDFIQLHNIYVKNGEEHFGIIVSKQLPIGEALRKLLALLLIHDSNSVKNKILFL